MAVYVDDFSAAAPVGGLNARWSHLIADTKEELHEFAERLGLKRAWFQDPPVNGKRPRPRPGSRAAENWHYDVVETKRKLAIKLGAQPIEWRQLHEVIEARIARDAAAAVTCLADLDGRPALSVRQPWAGLILSGAKGVENRTWGTDYRGQLVIHAGQRFDEDGAAVLAEVGLAEPTTSDDCPRGYLGMVELLDVHGAAGCCAPWGDPGRNVLHWVLRAPTLFPEPVPGPGQRSLYRIPAVRAAEQGMRS